MTALKPLKIGVFGLDDRAQKLLKLFFEGPCKGRFELVSRVLADIQLVDLDRPSGWGYYQKQRAINPKQPLVAISLDAGKETEVAHFIKKPMRLDTVLRVLEEAGGRFQHHVGEQQARAASASPGHSPSPASNTESQPAPATANERSAASATQRRKGSAMTADALADDQFLQFLRRSQDIDLARAHLAKDLFYDPAACFQGYFRNAVHLAHEQETPVRIGGFWGHLYIVPAENRAYSELLDSRLRPLTVMRMPKGDVEIEPVESAQIEQLAAKSGFMKTTSSIDALHWKLALWSSRGRLPPGTDIDAPIYLRRWPNFTRFLETPNAMRIAALWARHPASLKDTLEALGIRQAETFAFYSAAIAIGCAGIGQRQADSLISPVPVQPASGRGLFKRTLNRLFGNSDES